jgi:hypothetical protein
MLKANRDSDTGGWPVSRARIVAQGAHSGEASGAGLCDRADEAHGGPVGGAHVGRGGPGLRTCMAGSIKGTRPCMLRGGSTSVVGASLATTRGTGAARLAGTVSQATTRVEGPAGAARPSTEPDEERNPMTSGMDSILVRKSKSDGGHVGATSANGNLDSSKTCLEVITPVR